MADGNWQNNLLSDSVYGNVSFPYHTKVTDGQNLFVVVTDLVNEYLKKMLGLKLFQDYETAKIDEFDNATPLPQKWQDFEGGGYYEYNGYDSEHSRLDIMLAWFLRYAVNDSRIVNDSDFGGKRDSGTTTERVSAVVEESRIVDHAYNEGVLLYYLKQQFLLSDLDTYAGLRTINLTRRNTFNL